MQMIPALFATGGAAAAGTAAAGSAASAFGMGAAAGAAGAGAAGATGLGLSAMNILSGVVTAGSVLSGVMGGKAQAAELESRARMAEIDAGAQALESERRATEIRKKALQAQASNAVAFASSGIDSLIGTPASVNAGIESDALYQTGIERGNAERASLRGRIASSSYRTAAGNAEAGGLLSGLLAGTKYAIGAMNRG